MSSGENTTAGRRALEAAAIVALSIGLLGVAELAVRGIRGLAGEPTITRAKQFHERITEAVRLYRAHPFLNTGPRAGARVLVFGKDAHFNSLGYRSPERSGEPLDRGVRIVCAGGSTTFDIAAVDGPSTWPWRLEERLHRDERPVEVWNAGFPGWTSLENLISLAQRDLRLEPDRVILFQGINDLQPGGHVPFDPGYERGHAELARRALGLDFPPVHWSDRSVLLEQVRDWILGPDDPWSRLQAEPAQETRDHLPQAAVDTFRRNVRSFLGVAEAHGVRVLLVTQPLRFRARTREKDLGYLSGWLGGLDPENAPRELERFNQVLRELAEESSADLWDAAALDWHDRHFADPMHFSVRGSEFFTEKLAEHLEELGI